MELGLALARDVSKEEGGGGRGEWEGDHPLPLFRYVCIEADIEAKNFASSCQLLRVVQ